MTHPINENPVNPLPPVVVALFLVMAGLEITFFLANKGIIGGAGGVGWRIAAWESYGFSGRVFDWMVANEQWPTEHLIRFVSYVFVHASFQHSLFAMVILLAMGKIVCESLGVIAFLLIFFVSGVVGALVYGLLLDDPRLLIGAYPPVYGLIGGFTYLLWLRLGVENAPQIRAFTLIGFLLGLQLVFGMLFGTGNDWVAEIAGFVTGFVLSILLVPGGVRHMLNRIRRR